MKRYRRTTISQYVIIGVALIALIFFGFLNQYMMRRISFPDAFVFPWTAGRGLLLEGINPYAGETAELARETIDASSYQAGMPAYDAFMRPVVDLLFFLPIGLLNYEIARMIWVTFMQVVLLATILLALQISGWSLSIWEKAVLVVLVMMWVPSVAAAYIGTLSPFVILMLFSGIYFIDQQKDTLGGFLLSLTFTSLPITAVALLALVIWGISERRWSFLAAYFSGLVFLLTLSLLLLPSWPLDYLRILIDNYQNWEWVKTPLMQLAALLPGVSRYLSYFLHGFFTICLLVLMVTLWGKTGRSFVWKISTILAVSFLFNPQASPYEIFLVLPGLFLVFRFLSKRWGPVGRVITWLVCLVLAVLTWVAVWPLTSFQVQQNLVGLTIGLPLLVLLGLMYVRWWALHIPRLPFET